MKWKATSIKSWEIIYYISEYRMKWKSDFCCSNLLYNPHMYGEIFKKNSIFYINFINLFFNKLDQLYNILINLHKKNLDSTMMYTRHVISSLKKKKQDQRFLCCRK